MSVAEAITPVSGRARKISAQARGAFLTAVLAAEWLAISSPSSRTPSRGPQFWDVGFGKYLLLAWLAWGAVCGVRSPGSWVQLNLRLQGARPLWALAALHGFLFALAFCSSLILHGTILVPALSGSVRGGTIRLILVLAATATAIEAGLPGILRWKFFSETLVPALWSIGATAAALAFSRFRYSLWNALAASTFSVVRTILRPVIPDLVSAPAQRILGSPRFLVQIADTCGGVEGIGLTLAFCGVYLAVFWRDFRFPHSLLLTLGAAVTAYLANSLRIAGLILLGNAGASGTALAGFHSNAGWVYFLAISLGFCVAAQSLRRKKEG